MRKYLFYVIVLICLFISIPLTGCEDKEDLNIESVQEYSIYVKDNPNAKVTVDKTASVGSKVKIDITLSEGYYLEAIKVNDSYLTSKTFIMPECDVLIDVMVVNGTESYLVTTEENSCGTIYTVTERAKFGEEINVKVFPNEGYRLESLYANGVLIPFKIDEYGYHSTVVMQKEDMLITAYFKEVVRITDEYEFVLTATTPENPAKSYWRSEYLDKGILFSVLVEDTTIVNTASLSTYNNDNIEFQICKATNVSAMDKALAYRCLVNVAGRYLFQKANGVDDTYDHSSEGLGLLYGENFIADSTICKEEINGFNGYAIEVYIGYDLLNLTKEEAYGNLTFAPAIKDSVKYDYNSKQLTSYWTNTGYSHNRENGDRYFNNDEYKCEWGIPATFLGITKDNKIISRFMEVYKNVDYMFLGDSYLNPKFWGTYKEDTNDLFAVNFGFSGSYASDWNKESWYSTAAALSPKNIVVHIGLNDFNVGLKNYELSERTTKTTNRIKELITNLNKASKDSNIFWITMEPNESHKADYSYYKIVNEAMKEYAKTLDYLTIIETENVMLNNGNISPSLYLEDKLHMSSFGYARWVNTVKKALGLNTFESTIFGNANTGWMTSGWSESVVDGETILQQNSTSTKLTDKYIFIKDCYLDSFKAKASFNASKVYNGDSWPKFGFILDDGNEQVLIFIGTDSKLRHKSVGYVTRTASSDGKGAVFNWNTGSETPINCYFTGDDWTTLELVKNGTNLKVIVNGYSLYDFNLSVCKGNVSVGFFSFNTGINVKNVNVEVA